MIISSGSTDITVYYKLVDPSTGVPETGLTVTDLDMTYVRDASSAVKSDVTALAAVDSVHGDNKMFEVDSTNAPGLYRADFPDAAFAAGVDRVQLVINGAAIDPAYLEVELTVIEETVNAVWDEVLTGVTHNVSNSAGKRLRQLAGVIIHEGTAQGAGVDANQVQLAAAASALDGAYDPALVVIIGGMGAGQTRLILEYDGTTKMATVDRSWKVNPNATSEYLILADAGREHVNEGLAQDGGPSSITLNVLASDDNDAYVSQRVFIRSGAGEDQVRTISAYNGTTKVATVVKPWDTEPDNTSGYVMLATSTGIIDDVNITDDAVTKITASVFAKTGILAGALSTLTFAELQEVIYAFVAGTFTISGADPVLVVFKDGAGVTLFTWSVPAAGTPRTVT